MIAPEELAKMIDHTNVKGDATEDDIKQLCSEALKYNFASACVTPTNVVLTRKLLNILM
jgi:deoxyribose-phosphate aldolase